MQDVLSLFSINKHSITRNECKGSNSQINLANSLLFLISQERLGQHECMKIFIWYFLRKVET